MVLPSMFHIEPLENMLVTTGPGQLLCSLVDKHICKGECVENILQGKLIYFTIFRDLFVAKDMKRDVDMF